MKNQKTPNAQIPFSLLCLIPIIIIFSFVVARRAIAEETHSSEQKTGAEKWIHPSQNSEQQATWKQDDWKFTIGLGTMYKPAFLGSKDYQMMAFPNIKIEYKDRFFASPFGAGYKVIHNENFSIGPIIKLDFGRKEDNNNPFRIAGKNTNALRGLGNVDATIELGGFVEYSIGPFTYQLELRQGLGGHKGFIAETGLNLKGFIEKSGKPIMYSFGPRATFADANYNNAYFGISKNQSTNSGLSRYDAVAGLVSYGVAGFVAVPVMDSFSIGVFGGYDRLARVASDSPLIKKRGDANQFTGGMRITYEFGF
ncbi:MipA/OmpV family protein [Desulfolutivibrio sp.]|uniref:MipA/OmpV family protein n=1 Tax=Desulfolutivibrio sp. TaxID=2773296 RepID=UPI002F96151D